MRDRLEILEIDDEQEATEKDDRSFVESMRSPEFGKVEEPPQCRMRKQEIMAPSDPVEVNDFSNY